MTRRAFPSPLPPVWRGRAWLGRRGVALLAVLWVLAGAGTAAAIGLAAVRDGIATSRHRTEHTRARWAADGCLAEFRMRLEGVVRPENDHAWLAPHVTIPHGCAVTVTPPSDGPVDLNLATDSVLGALPGFDPEVLEVVRRERAWGRRIGSLDALLGLMPPDLRERLTPHYADLVGRVVFAPPAWVVTGHGRVGGRPVPVVAEWWVRAGNRVAVVRREIR
jgi:hypothetical protein